MNRRRNSAIATGLAGLLAIGGCFDPIRDPAGQVVGWQYNEARTTKTMEEGVGVALVVGSVGMAAMGGLSDNPVFGISSRLTGMAMQQAAKGINGNNAGAVVTMEPYFTDQFACVQWDDRNKNGSADSDKEFVGRDSRFRSDGKITLVSKVVGGVGHRITCNLVEVRTGRNTLYDLGKNRFPDGQVNFVSLGPKSLRRGVYEARWFIDGKTTTRSGFVVDDGDKPLIVNANIDTEDSAMPSGEVLDLRVSSERGISPLLVSYSARIDKRIKNGSYVLWTLDGQPLSNGRNGQTYITKPGEHVLSALLTDESGQEYRAEKKITLSERTRGNN